MLEKLKITRFKSVRDVELDLGRVNLFIGGNGSGKSNLLEAIGLTSACLGRGLSDADMRSKGLRITPPELMKSSFKNEDLPKTLELSAEFGGDISYKAVLQSRENDPFLRFFSEASECSGRRIFGRSNRGASALGISYADRLDPSRGVWDQIKLLSNIRPEIADVFSEFSRFVIYSPQTDFLRGRSTGSVDTPPVGLRGEGLSEAVSSFLDAVATARHKNRRQTERGKAEYEIIQSCANLAWLPGWASAVGTHIAKPVLTSRELAGGSRETVFLVDTFMHTSRNQLSVYDSSEGTLFLLFVAIILSHPDAPKIFALDNVDNSLNPKLTKRLVEQIITVSRKASESRTTLGARQIFLTSHNPTALDAFDLFDNNQRVFVVRRNEKGHTIADRLSPHMSRNEWQKATSGRNLSQLWLDGDIPGALGNL